MKFLLKKLVCLSVCASILPGVLFGCGSADYTAAELLKNDNYNISDYVTICNISDIDISEIEKENVTDERIESAVNAMLEFFPDYIEKDKSIVENEDTVNIDYIGIIDGEKIDTESDTDCYITIGNNTMAEGFDTKLVGHKVGDEFSFVMKLLGNYENANYAGKKVSYTVKINGIYDQRTYTCDNVTDEYIAKNFEYDTLNSYKKYMKEFLEESNESSYQEKAQMEIVNQLVKKSNITIPDGLYDQMVEDLVSDLQSAAKTEDMDVDEYVQQHYGYDSLEEYKQNQTEVTEASIKQDLVAKKLMLDYNISFSQKEFDEFLAEYIEYYGCESEEQLYEIYGSKEDTLIAFGEIKAMEKLVSKIAG